jgi:hypothetical protein
VSKLATRIARIEALAAQSPPRELGHRAFDPPRIARLRDLQKTLDFAGPLATAQLSAAAGRFGKADAQLAEIVRRFGAALPAAPHFASALFCAAVACQRLDIAGEVLSLREDHPYRVAFGTGLPAKMIVRVTVQPDRTCLVTLKPGVVGGAHIERLLAQLLGIAKLLTAYVRDPSMPPGDCLASLGDIANVPGLGFSAADARVHLVPDTHFINSHAYEGMRTALAAEPLAWAERRPIAFWRGASTGTRLAPDRHWRTLQRIRLCEKAADSGGLVDAGINKVVQAVTPGEAAEIAAAGLMKPSVPATDFKRYRYQIDVDGNSNSWAGLFIKLLTGNPVLKVTSPGGFRQWYYDRLEPWVNYVPVCADMSDLMDRIDDLRRDDARAQAIGQAGYELATSLDFATQVDAAKPVIAASFRAAAKAGGVAPGLAKV